MNTNALQLLDSGEAQLVQIAGVPRSGTTLMSTMIENHPCATCLIEPYLSWMKHGYFRYRDGSGLDDATDVFEKRRPHELLAELCQRSALRVVAFKETFRTPDHPTFPSQAFLQANHRRGAVHHTLAVVRDPRDVWASIISRHPHFEGNRPVLHELTTAWNELCTWIRRDDLLHLRYEDLAADPSRLDPILATIGLSPDSATRSPARSAGYGDKRAQEGGDVDTSSVGRHQHALSASVRDAITARCKTHMDGFDYAPA